jgi:lipopolysaccharide/colanic/teichoic acid biosynthesis glycosyltransferase
MLERMKRLFDFLAALTGLLLLSPLLIVLAVWVLLDDGKPVFFRQERVGQNGVLFKLLKFRSMYRDAEKRGQLTVGGRDPRITKSGYLLRKYKLDELPQLWNVVKGDMSIVGPRPEVPKYVNTYTDAQREVLSVRPGLTDPASVEYIDEDELLGRSKDPEATYINEILPAKVDLQLRYVRERSFKKDLGVILQTLKHLVR